MTRLAGKTALVTGAGQGVGRGIALALAAEGANVAITGRTEEKLKVAAAEIEQHGVRALPLPCDGKDPQQLAATVDEVIKTLGAPDILVNNAQQVPLGRLDDVTDDAL